MAADLHAIPDHVANEQVGNSFGNSDASGEVQVAGVENTRTGSVITGKEDELAETATINTPR